MAQRTERSWDPVAGTIPLITAATAVIYVWLLQGQGPLWFLGWLSVATLLAAYSTFRAAPARGLVLILATAILALLGVVSLFSVGLLVLAAAILGLVATARCWIPVG